MLRLLRKDARPDRGFTLVELMVVMIVIAVLVAIIIANYIRMKRHAEMASCIANQRNILEACITYSIDNVVPDGDMNVGDLLADHAVGASLCNCPSEEAKDQDDYTITWLDGHPRDVRCDVKGDDHDWHPH
jgi:prepilin-type N-terminal cleavage/methylation domain-containing protein